MADHDDGPRGAEDEPRGPEPGSSTWPYPSEAAAASPPPHASAAFGSGPGPRSEPPTYAYGPGGAGWGAPGWAAPPQNRQRGRLLAAGLAGLLAGALLGGGAVAVGSALWHRNHGPTYGITWNNGDPGMGRVAPFGRGFGQGMPGMRTRHLPQFCRRTDTGFRCDRPSPQPPASPSPAPTS